MSGKDGSSCNADFQCGLGLSCITNDVWPFISSCQKLRVDGEKCEDDRNC